MVAGQQHVRDGVAFPDRRPDLWAQIPPKPPVWEGHAIPEVLLSGDHAKVAAWRRAEAERVTRERRPDLWNARKNAKNEP